MEAKQSLLLSTCRLSCRHRSLPELGVHGKDLPQCVGNTSSASVPRNSQSLADGRAGRGWHEKQQTRFQFGWRRLSSGGPHLERLDGVRGASRLVTKLPRRLFAFLLGHGPLHPRAACVVSDDFHGSQSSLWQLMGGLLPGWGLLPTHQLHLVIC